MGRVYVGHGGRHDRKYNIELTKIERKIVQAPGQQLLETLVISTYEVLWVGAIILGGNGGQRWMGSIGQTSTHNTG